MLETVTKFATVIQNGRNITLCIQQVIICLIQSTNFVSLTQMAENLLVVYTVEPRYLELAYFELPLISK